MTDDFSADWLTLREPYDTAARSRSLAAAFLEALPTQPRTLDLGAGRGANARFLNDLSADDINWRLVDRDPVLLGEASQLISGASHQLVDFAADPASIDVSQADAVSASALFDLVSEPWFARFLKCIDGLPLLFAMTANGTHLWRPADPADPVVMARFEADMKRDKGFGPAMGADAPRIMAALLSQEGYRVRSEPSFWQLGSDDSEILTVLVDLIADVANNSNDGPEIEAWRTRRHRLIAMNELSLEVGHIDLLALPD